MDALDLLRGPRIDSSVVRFFFFQMKLVPISPRQQMMKGDAFQMLLPSHTC